jgi:hypothetical protein
MFKLILALSATIFTYTATADPLPAQTGPAEVNLIATTQATDFGEIRSRTNHTKTATNEISILKATLRTAPFHDRDLVALLANSFHTNFPAGSQIGIGFGGLYVLDASGTNVLLYPQNAVLSGTFTVLLTTGLAREVTPVNGPGGRDIGIGFMETTAILTMTYDDTALTTTDGTHTKFTFQGPYTQRNSLKKSQTEVNTTIEFHGSAGGKLRDIPVMLTGSITGKALTSVPPPS